MILSIQLIEENQISFESKIIKEELHKYIQLLDPSTKRSIEFIKICGWCKKVFVNDMWLEIEHAIIRLNLFEYPHTPQTINSVCPFCKNDVMKKLGD
jgi:hypothetical protein